MGGPQESVNILPETKKTYLVGDKQNEVILLEAYIYGRIV